MAGQAIAHAQRHLPRYDLHVLHLAVARLTSNARSHVWPMVEINMIRQTVNALPFKRLA